MNTRQIILKTKARRVRKKAMLNLIVMAAIASPFVTSFILHNL